MMIRIKNLNKYETIRGQSKKQQLLINCNEQGDK